MSSLKEQAPVKLCIWGKRCTNKECKFFHPEGQALLKPCTWGKNCTNKKCRFFHPEGQAPSAGVP